MERIADPSFFLNVEMKDYRPETLDRTIKTLEKYGFHYRYVIACFYGDVTTLAYEKYGVKTQGFPLQMVKEAREDTESHCYFVGIGMEMLIGELVESYYRKVIEKTVGNML